jgi:hypothetical protein
VTVAGYSGTPLAKKLGIRGGDAVAVLGAPDGFEGSLEGLPAGVTFRRRAGGSVDLAIAFHTRRADLERRLPTVLRSLPPDGALWVAWPKRASGVATDITEDVVRDVCLPTGLVDTKVCAIDGTWSGLKLVVRKELRAGRTTAAG